MTKQHDHSKSTLEEILRAKTHSLGPDQPIVLMVSAGKTQEGKIRIRVPAVVYETPGEFEIEGNLCLPVIGGNRVIR